MATGSLRKYKKEAEVQATADFAAAKRTHDEKSEHRHFSEARYIKDDDSYRDGFFKADTFSDEELSCLAVALKNKTGKVKMGGGDDPTDHDFSVCETLEYVMVRIRASKMEAAVKGSIEDEQAARAKRRGEAS